MGGNTSATSINPNTILPSVISNPGSIYKWDNTAVQIIIGTLLSGTTELAYLGSVIPQSLLDKLALAFPEFWFATQSKDYLYCQRLRYLGDVNSCCLTDTTYYLTNNNQWYTCDPLTKSPGVSNICDGVLLNYCVSNPINTSVCTTWYNGLNARYNNNESNAIILIQNIFDIVSRSNISNIFYDDVMDLYHKWNINNQLFDERLRLLSQSNRYKYLCSFPLQDIINMSNEYSTPRVCWDPNCTNASPGKILTADMVTRANCTITICNVEISKYVSSYKTYLDSSCTTKTRNQVSLTNVLRSFNKSVLDLPSIEYLTLIAVSVGLIVNSMKSLN
jgi:hypothetical protein